MDVPRIVVLRALGLGDLLTAVPALRALRAWEPSAELMLACPAPLHELVQHWRLADTNLDTAPLGRVPSEGAAPQVAVNLHGRGPESTTRLLELSPERLVAFAHAELPQTRGLPEWRADEHEVHRWCRLLTESGIPADPRKLNLSTPPRRSPITPGGVVLHPGASAPARRWPADRWAAVARSLRSDGRRVLVTGSGDEHGLCLEVAHAANLSWADVVAGRTSLLDLAALVGRAELVLCGDTGVAHLATALGTPSVVLFGPVSPAHWGPPAERPIHRVLWTGATGDPNADTPDPGLLEITVEDVLGAVTRLRKTIAA